MQRAHDARVLALRQQVRTNVRMSEQLPRLPRRRWHRGVFLVAGVYNLFWGLYSAIDPQWLFRFAAMPPMRHPQIFACLGMVIGLYGVGYLEVARRPERGFVLAAIGLGGKVLGPIGLLQLVASGTWPPATVVLTVSNDLIWWVPFALYLRDVWPVFRADEVAHGGGRWLR